MTRLVPASIFNELRNDPFLVGFDQIFDRLVSTGTASAQAPSYPPYNIVKVNDSEFRIELAVAGFSEDEIEVTVQEDTLTIESNKNHGDSGVGEQLIHQGIAERNFKRTWTLSPTVCVTSASFVNGLLEIHLVNQVPEKAKPRKIILNGGSAEGPQVLNG